MADIAQLRWQARRGLRELDTLLLHYLEHQYPQLDHVEQAHFQALLQLDDQQLHAILLQGQPIAQAELAATVRAILSQAANREATDGA